MKKYFISFGNKNFKNQLIRLCKTAKETNWFDGVIADDPNTIEDFIKNHEGFILNNPRGYGYWIWKPYIILRQLLKMDEGDYLFYTDAGSKILPHRESRFKEYLDKLKQQPVLISGNGCSYFQYQFIKKSLLSKFNLENNIEFLNSSHCESGMIAIRKCKESVDLIKTWSELIIADNYINTNDDLGNDEQLEGFIDHRHDQSILNILFWLNDYQTLPVSNCYGLGPFFSSRETDAGFREFAADWWRAEPDYIDSESHPLIAEYITSKTDPEWWKNQKDYNSDTMFNQQDYLDFKWKEQLNL